MTSHLGTGQFKRSVDPYFSRTFQREHFEANTMKLFVGTIFMSGVTAQYSNAQVSTTEAKFATSVFNTMTICNDWIERALGTFSRTDHADLVSFIFRHKLCKTAPFDENFPEFVQWVSVRIRD